MSVEGKKTDLHQLQVGLMGCGRMGTALAKAWISRGGLQPSQLYLCDKIRERAQELGAELGAQSVDSLATKNLDILLLAVKPQDVRGALGAIDSRVSALVSIVAGLTTDRLAKWLPEEVVVLRAMPNTPALVGAGITAVLQAKTPEHRAWMKRLFEPCGAVVELAKEDYFDAVTGLSGSGPAYCFMAMEALADGGVKMGLPRDVALKLAIHTLRGAGELAIVTGTHPAQLKDAVASPGGTTIHGLAILEQAEFRSALIHAVEAATLRGRELGKG